MRADRAIAVALSATVALFGCAHQWDPNGASPQQYNVDKYNCQRDSQTFYNQNSGTNRQALAQNVGSILGAQWAANTKYDDCMRAHSYTVHVDRPSPQQYVQTPGQPQPAANGTPPGAISPGLYYQQAYPGAALVIAPPSGFPGPGSEWDVAARDYGMPVEPVWGISGPAAREGSAPAVVVGIKAQSTYLFEVEHIAKVSQCDPPAAAMTSKGAGQESFIVACPNGTSLAMKCDAEGCRILR